MSSTDNIDKKNRSNSNNENIFRVSLLGAEGTGKSCFLAGLAFLGLDPLQALLQIDPQDSETEHYLNSLNRAFQNGDFPPPTNITSILNFNLQLPRSPVMNVQTIDYPGEDFRHAIINVTPEQAARFSRHLLESDIVILLIDATDVSSDNNEKQVILREKLRACMKAVYTAVQHNVKTVEKRNKKIDLCIGMTKCDLMPFYQQIVHSSDGGGGRVIRQFMNRNWENFEKNLRDGINDGTNIKNIRYFGLSAIGTTDSETGKPVKGQIKPFGYKPMFRWIAERSIRISSRKFKRVCFLLIPIIIIIIIVFAICYRQGGIDQFSEQWQLEILDDENMTVAQKLAQTQFPVNDNIIVQRNSLIDAELIRLKNIINQTNNEQTLGEIREELKKFDNINFVERRVELDKLKTEIENRSIEIEMKRVRDSFELRSAIFSEDAKQFLTRYPLSVQADEVRELQKQYEDRKIKAERNLISQIAITNIESLQEKNRQIFSFLERYENRLNQDEVSAMKRAANLAKQFTERRNYSITINQYGGFAYNERQKVSVYINDVKVASHDSKGNVEIVFPGTLFSITWQCGDKIRFELQGYGVYDFETAASYTSSSPISLQYLNQKTRLLPQKGTWDWRLPKLMRADGYFIKCTIQNKDINNAKAWKAFEDYITPGNSW
ncbi:MAG: hypothetical protein LBE12_08360 [Planctomycetaceae bacterium]|jgi:hypothetical protein|nr:hypothetical protein [Planctomycetaceae bacterium]